MEKEMLGYLVAGTTFNQYYQNIVYNNIKSTQIELLNVSSLEIRRISTFQQFTEK